MKFWIDDNRPMPTGYDAQAWTVAQAVATLAVAKREGHRIELMSFDYDAHHTLNWTFKEVVFWMVENDFWPDELRVHTFNFWLGRPWLLEMFKAHAPESTKIDLFDPWYEMGYRSGRPANDTEVPDWYEVFKQEVQVVH